MVCNNAGRETFFFLLLLYFVSINHHLTIEDFLWYDHIINMLNINPVILLIHLPGYKWTKFHQTNRDTIYSNTSGTTWERCVCLCYNWFRYVFFTLVLFIKKSAAVSLIFFCLIYSHLFLWRKRHVVLTLQLFSCDKFLKLPFYLLQDL